MLPTTSDFITSLPFFLCVTLVCFAKPKAILKFSLIVFILNLIIIVYLFASAFSQLDFTLISSVDFTENGNIPAHTFRYLLTFFFPLIIPLIFANENGIAVTKKEISLSLIFSFVLIAVSSATCLFFFGQQLTGKFDYIYYSVVSTINHGKLFSRVDEFSFAVYFFSSFTICAVCLSVIKKAVSEINRKLPFFVMPAISLLAFIMHLTLQ